MLYQINDFSLEMELSFFFYLHCCFTRYVSEKSDAFVDEEGDDEMRENVNAPYERLCCVVVLLPPRDLSNN